MPTYTATIPSNSQTDRQDLNDAMSAILAAFITVHPTVVRKYWSEVPPTIVGEGPFVYLGDITEAVAHDMQTRGTVFSGHIGYVDTLADMPATNRRVNVFADFMRDMFTSNSRITSQSGSTGLLEQRGFQEGEITQGNARLTDCRLFFTYSILRGRNFT